MPHLVKRAWSCRQCRHRVAQARHRSRAKLPGKLAMAGTERRRRLEPTLPHAWFVRGMADTTCRQAPAFRMQSGHRSLRKAPDLWCCCIVRIRTMRDSPDTHDPEAGLVPHEKPLRAPGEIGARRRVARRIHDRSKRPTSQDGLRTTFRPSRLVRSPQKAKWSLPIRYHAGAPSGAGGCRAHPSSRSRPLWILSSLCDPACPCRRTSCRPLRSARNVLLFWGSGP